MELRHPKQPRLPVGCPFLDPEGQGAVEAALLLESLKPKDFVSLAASVREASGCLHRCYRVGIYPQMTS